MSATIFRRYLKIGEAEVAYSALQAGGFHPSFHNYHHAHYAYLEMIALGGIIVMLPKNEIHDAKEWLSYLQSRPNENYDPIFTQNYTMWKRSSALCLGMGFLFPLPILFLPPLLLLIIFSIIFICSLFAASLAFTFALFFLVPTLILTHAHYIALPRIQRNTPHEP